MSDAQALALVGMFCVGLLGGAFWWHDHGGTPEQKIRRKQHNRVVLGWLIFWTSPPLISLFLKGILG